MTDTLNPPTTGHDDIDATIASLLTFAAWRTAHPEIDLFRSSTGAWLISSSTNGAPADVVRAVCDGAPIGTIKKSTGSGTADDTLFVDRDFGNNIQVRYLADRDEVCTRRVVGTETVQVPDPDAPKVSVEREIVEWDCAPILAASSAGGEG